MFIVMGISNPEEMDVLIRTFNSGDTIRDCLTSVENHIPKRKIIVADHNSTDDTVSIAKSFGAEVHEEEVGLGYATKMLISLAETRYVLFVDGDITIVNPNFVKDAMKLFNIKNTGAVVGCALGHDFLFGIPLGLTLMPLELLKKIDMPDSIQGRETFYFEELMRKNSLKVRYVRDSMIHRSTYRKYRYWPEWQGAQIRFTPSGHFRQLVNALTVVFMMHINSKSKKNFLYSPIYYLKLLNGYSNPRKWGSIDRRIIEPELRKNE